MKRRIIKCLSSSILIIGISLSLTAPTYAGVDDFYFSDFTADYHLSKDPEGVSQMRVIERLTAEFPDFNQNKGIIRLIPRANQDGQNRTIDRLNISITRNGLPEPIYDISTQSKYFEVSTGTDDYITGTQEFIFDYGFVRVITDFDNYQELYWDTNGTGWFQTFGSLTARVHLPEDIVGNFTGESWCYVGRQGSNNQSDCEINITDNIVTFRSLRPLTFNENLTFVLKFAPDSFTIPPRPRSYALLIALTILLILTFAILAICLFVIRPKYMTTARKYLKSPIPPQYLPPEDLSVAESCLISTSSRKNTTIPAQLVELAVSGKIKIIQSDPKSKPLFGRNNYSIELLSTAHLTPIDIRTLTVLKGDKNFEKGTIIEISSTYNSQKATAATSFTSAVDRSTVSRGYRIAKQTSPILLFAILYAVIAIISIPVCGGLVDTFIGSEFIGSGLIPVTVIAAIITLVVLFSLSHEEGRYSKLTEQGFELNNYLRGLYDYIKLAESDRIKFLQSPDRAEKIPITDKTYMVHLYEKLLPYAIIFGLEKSWAKQLEVYYQGANSTPTWYHGLAGFSAASFSSSLTSFSSSVSSSVASSSSSGSGGGGSSGGGGGGGGGGGR